MNIILSEIKKALQAGCYYLSVASALTLPDICASLEADRDADPALYKKWFDVWLKAKLPTWSGEDMYRVRCSVVHQGTSNFHASYPDHRTVVFVVPGAIRLGATGKTVESANRPAVIEDAVRFCEVLMEATSEWYAAHKDDPTVLKNFPRLLQLRPNGFPPNLVGIPVIASA